MSNKTSEPKSKLNCDFKHHAYCLVGEKLIVLESLHKELEEKLNFNTIGNADYWFAEYDKLNMKDGTREVVREEILSQALLRPVNGENRVMVICANFVNDNVQNSLLKFFEEPIPGLKVFLILPNDNHLLPTVKSRLITLFVEGKSDSDEKLLSEEKFLSGQIYVRMKMVSEITSSLSDDEITRGDVVAFFRRLEKRAFQNTRKHEMDAVSHNSSKLDKTNASKNNDWLLKLEKICRYADDPSSSFKVLLEYLALVMPKF